MVPLRQAVRQDGRALVAVPEPLRSQKDRVFAVVLFFLSFSLFLIAMVSKLIAMASIQPTSDGLQPTSDGLQPTSY